MIRFLKILLAIPLLYIIITPFWLSSFYGSRPCGGIAISISDSSDYHFVTKRQLLNIASANNGKIVGQPVKSISLYDVENRINVLRDLKVAEVYMTIDGTI